MRCLLAVALFTLYFPAWAQQNQAEELYNSMKQKLAKAKGYIVRYDAKAGGDEHFKGMLAVAPSGKFKLTAEGKDGKRDVKMEIVCDGQQTVRIIDGKASKVVDAPKDAGKYVTDLLTTMCLSLVPEQTMRKERLSLQALTLSDFKSGVKGKVGDRDAELIIYKVTAKGAVKATTVQLWLDSKTHLPLQRVITLDGDTYRIEETYAEWLLDAVLKDDDFKLPKQ